MTIPMSVVVFPFLAAFGMFTLMYYRADPERRIVNRYFPLVCGAILMIFVEIVANVGKFDVGRLNLLLFPLALIWLALAIVMWRRMPRKNKR